MPSKKDKRSKKDLLNEAIDEELKQVSEQTLPVNDDPIEETPERETIENKNESKKGLPERSEINEDAMMEEALKNIDKDLGKRKIKYEDGSSKTSTIIGVIIITMLIIAGYFYFTGESTEPRILLGTTPITESNYASFKAEKLTFPIGKAIYIYFVTGGRLGVDHVDINIIEEIKIDNNTNYEMIGNLKASTKPNWRNFNAHFQKDYFRNPGNYKIQLLSSSGKLLIENSFVIK